MTARSTISYAFPVLALVAMGVFCLMNSDSSPVELDPLSIAPVRTTPPPCLDILELLPQLRNQARTTIRLHPRRLPAGQTLPLHVSKLGGDFLWPADEPWPTCPKHRIAYVGVLQLRKDDFGEVAFKDDADLLQVLWCPQHGHGSHAPEPVLFWRKTAEVTNPLTEIPQPRFPTSAEEADERRQSALEHDLNCLVLFETHPDYMRQTLEHYKAIPPPSSETWIPHEFLELSRNPVITFNVLQKEAAALVTKLERHRNIPDYAESQYVPQPCRLFPERVTEYSIDGLSEQEQQRLLTIPPPAASGDRSDNLLDLLAAELTVADGTKLQGYVRWSQTPEEPRCKRGHPMEHLLTIASWEWDGGNWYRWRAAEDAPLYEQLRSAQRYDAAHKLLQPHGMTLGDAAAKYVFICERCTDWPTRSVIQD